MGSACERIEVCVFSDCASFHKVRVPKSYGFPVTRSLTSGSHHAGNTWLRWSLVLPLGCPTHNPDGYKGIADHWSWRTDLRKALGHSPSGLIDVTCERILLCFVVSVHLIGRCDLISHLCVKFEKKIKKLIVFRLSVLLVKQRILIPNK